MAADRTLAELLTVYNDRLLSTIGKVRILGETNERDLKNVFVDLTVADKRPPAHHADILGPEIHSRFSPSARKMRFAGAFRHKNQEQRSLINPDDLCREGTKAIVTGTPGCGKTTLLKYLALNFLQKEGKYPMWIDLKAISKSLFVAAEASAAHHGNLILNELWLGQLRTRLSLSGPEASIMGNHFLEEFRANRIAVFLDGFDELQTDDLQRGLGNCINEFAAASHNNVLLVSTRLYAQHKVGTEYLQVFEIEPLNEQQIEAFLSYYYPSEPTGRTLLLNLRQELPLGELLHIPLLLGMVLTLHREHVGTSSRLVDLYAVIVARLVRDLDRSKSIHRHFRIDDDRLRLDFLKSVAFQRLMPDGLVDASQTIMRFVFNYDFLREHAERFLSRERSLHNPRDLANDALATPLLRELDSGLYAFTHLTLQEYLAACAFAELYRSKAVEAVRLFCRAYHDPSLGEMEVLPMTLAILADADGLYSEIAHWPDSLSFANLRLQARGLSYSAVISPRRRLKLVNRLVEFIVGRVREEAPYREIVINSMVGATRDTVTLIEDQLISRELRGAELHNAASALECMGSPKALDLYGKLLNESIYGVYGLGRIGSDKAVTLLRSAYSRSSNNPHLQLEMLSSLGNTRLDSAIDILVSVVKKRDDQLHFFPLVATRALGNIVTDRAIDALLGLLRDKTNSMRNVAAESLGWIGANRAVGELNRDKIVEAVIAALNEEDRDRHFLSEGIWALGRISSDRAIDALMYFLRKPGGDLRSSAAHALGWTRSRRALGDLIKALNDNDQFVRDAAASALGKIGSDTATDALITALKDGYVGSEAARALGEIRSQRAIDWLTLALRSNDRTLRLNALYGLGGSAWVSLTQDLIKALNDADHNVVKEAAQLLGRLGSREAVAPLIAVLEKRDEWGIDLTRSTAATALGDIGSQDAVDSLVSVLQDNNSFLRWHAAEALGKIGSDKAFEALRVALRDKDNLVRWCTATALGKIASDRAVKILLSMLNHRDSTLRENAAEALRFIPTKVLAAGLEATISRGGRFARKRAVTTVGYYVTDDRVLQLLRRVAKADANADVQRAARQAARHYQRKMELVSTFSRGGTAKPLRDNESRELYLVGETFRIVAEAGHIFRPTPNSDWGIDGEIEFKDDNGQASGRRVYLQLKSGDSHLRRRKGDGKEVFPLRSRHVRYWQSHAYPVLLVIRDSKGRIRWMNITKYLQKHGATRQQVEFQGQPFTPENVNRLSACVAH